MKYNNDVPEFLAKLAVDYVNKRFDITKEQYDKLIDLEDRLKIPPSAIVRLALNCFFPKLTHAGYTEDGIRNLWNERKF